MKAAGPELLIVAAFSRHVDALSWAREELEKTFGPIALTSTPYRFTHTAYYESTMGRDLQKQFFTFEELVPPDQLAMIKRHAIQLEEELAATGRFSEARPLNIDPGLLNLGKFMLATTKDQAHRIYLHDGIFAEVTLHFEDGEFVPWPWTYADYREPVVLTFLKQARDWYKKKRQHGV